MRNQGGCHCTAVRFSVDFGLSQPMPDGTTMAAVNMRCLDGVDLRALDIKQVDGRSR